MTRPILETRGLHKSFGGLTVFNDVDFTLAPGERRAVIGPNGAGKTTFIALLTGLLPPSGGKIWLDGSEITQATPQARVKAGLGRTFQINTLFADLSPLESTVLALAQRDGLARPSLRPVAAYPDRIEEAEALLVRFGLADDRLTPTATLPYGRQRLLEVVLALALRPKVLLLDEPAAGLSTRQGHALFQLLAELARDTTLLFIEHDMDLVFTFADRVTVFALGSVIADDTPAEIRRHPRVREVYLGH